MTETPEQQQRRRQEKADVQPPNKAKRPQKEKDALTEEQAADGGESTLSGRPREGLRSNPPAEEGD